MSKGQLQILLAAAILAVLYFAFRKKECVNSTLSFPSIVAGDSQP